jgi:hypothetical protein
MVLVLGRIGFLLYRAARSIYQPRGIIAAPPALPDRAVAGV